MESILLGPGHCNTKLHKLFRHEGGPFGMCEREAKARQSCSSAEVGSDSGAASGPRPLGDLAPSIAHLQRQFAPGQVRFGAMRAQIHVSRIRKASGAGQRSGRPGVLQNGQKRWGVDGSTREGVAMFPSCSPHAAHPFTAACPTTGEAKLNRGTLKTQTLKKSIVSCQIVFLKWLPRI